MEHFFKEALGSPLIGAEPDEKKCVGMLDDNTMEAGKTNLS